MNKQFNIDLIALKTLYLLYKEYLVPAGLLLASVLLFLFVILPQFNDIVRSRAMVDELSKKNAILASNIQQASSISDDTLNSELQTLSSALPPVKDFTGIISAITAASDRSGVALNDYNFQIGDITKEETSKDAKLPSIDLSLSIRGTAQSIRAFLRELSQTSPLSDVSSVSTVNGAAETRVSFFYKTFPSVQVNNFSPIQMLSKEQQNIIGQLTAYQSR